MHSFAPDTRVLLADGSSVPIEDVKLGDEVVATDPQTGETAAREVTDLHLNVDTDLTNLTVVDVGTGEQSVLETTQNHPFWEATTGEWVEASKLTPGHRLLVHDEDRLEGDGTGAGSGGGGPPAEIEVVAVDNHTGSQVMRDLTVADIHTYHVLAGDDPVLVHNNNECFDPEAAAEGLPAWSEGQPTLGRASGRDANGQRVDYDLLWSGDTRNHAGLIDAVNARLRAAGILRGSSRSARASDLEQKFAALMNGLKILEADVVLNNPNGPCRVILGCDQTLNHILDRNRGLTVHWQDSEGAWQRADYGTRRRR